MKLFRRRRKPDYAEIDRLEHDCFPELFPAADPLVVRSTANDAVEFATRRLAAASERQQRLIGVGIPVTSTLTAGTAPYYMPTAPGMTIEYPA